MTDTDAMLGHLGINVPDLVVAKRYYDVLMPLVGFEPFFHTDDEFSYRPAGNKPGTYLFFYPAAQLSEYSSYDPASNTWHSSCGDDPWCTPCTTTSWRSAAPSSIPLAISLSTPATITPRSGMTHSVSSSKPYATTTGTDADVPVRAARCLATVIRETGRRSNLARVGPARSDGRWGSGAGIVASRRPPIRDRRGRCNRGHRGRSPDASGCPHGAGCPGPACRGLGDGGHDAANARRHLPHAGRRRRRGPQDVQLTDRDVLIFATKTQQLDAALREWVDRPVYGPGGPHDLVGTAGDRLPVMTALNGVAAEEKALRYFRRVFGVCVWLPAVHLEPGEVIVRSWPVVGQFHIARWPASVSTQADADLLTGLAETWSAAGIRVRLPDDVAPWKYNKLLSNLGNAIGPCPPTRPPRVTWWPRCAVKARTCCDMRESDSSRSRRPRLRGGTDRRSARCPDGMADRATPPGSR